MNRRNNCLPSSCCQVYSYLYVHLPSLCFSHPLLSYPFTCIHHKLHCRNTIVAASAFDIGEPKIPGYKKGTVFLYLFLSKFTYNFFLSFLEFLSLCLFWSNIVLYREDIGGFSMIKQPATRNQRYKGFKVKHFVHMCALLALCIWLLNQFRNTYEKKGIGIVQNGMNEDGAIKLGRKALDPQVQGWSAANNGTGDVEGEIDGEKAEGEENEVEDLIDEEDTDKENETVDLVMEEIV
ncbi:hypothetical protein Godav_013397 [Gossypium davidsonii]|uniref:Uncharacterized protein n=2 Tax=Gossypium TaxID=3633 RepID=A0A7J8RG81_GOSDV|nr:hypothetical protein [Gossypium davidsonii]MBA0648052.1 hypothetical protein [Gossypium klotzschianum]